MRARISLSSAASAKIRCSSCKTSRASWVGSKAEAGRHRKHGAKMAPRRRERSSAKFTVVVGGSYGAGNYGMCRSAAYEARLMFMLANYAHLPSGAESSGQCARRCLARDE